MTVQVRCLSVARTGQEASEDRLSVHDAIITPPNDGGFFEVTVGRPIFSVVDGLGGHPDGAVAASELIQLVSCMSGSFKSVDDLNARTSELGCRLNAMNPKRPPGAVIVGIVLIDGLPICFWAGDALAYTCDETRPVMVNEPHVVDLYGRNLVQNSIGGGTEDGGKLSVMEISDSSRVVLCSDGASQFVEAHDWSEQLSGVFYDFKNTKFEDDASILIIDF